MKARVLLVSAAVSLFPLLAAPAPAEPVAETPAARLTIGDAAPGLSVDTWVRGESVPSFEPGRVYVVEFWATWCGPCIRAIPHLTELQRAYEGKGVSFIAVTKADSKGNTLEKVREVTRKKNEEGLMTYTVAWEESGATSAAYMDAARRTGIPCVFVVDQSGRIAFIGHPMDLDEPLSKIVAREWDAGAFREVYEREMAADAVYREFFFMMKEGRLDEASRLGFELIEKHKRDDAGALNAIAWKIVNPKEKHARRDGALALAAATRAAELTDNKDPGILDTLAWACHTVGEHDEAVRVQTLAVDLAGDNAEMRAELEGALEVFRAAQRR